MTIATISLAIFSAFLFIQTKNYADSTSKNYEIRNRPFVKIDLMDITYIGFNKDGFKDPNGKWIGDYGFGIQEKLTNFGNFPAIINSIDGFYSRNPDNNYSHFPRAERINTWENIPLFPTEPITQSRRFFITKQAFQNGNESRLLYDPTYLIYKVTYSLLGDESNRKQYFYWIKYKYRDVVKDAEKRKLLENLQLSEEQKQSYLFTGKFEVKNCGDNNLEL